MRLVDAGEADVNEVEGAGCTPLHSAAFDGWARGIELLLGLGAKLDASNNAGDRPYHFAANMGHADAAALLVSHGARTDKGDVLVQEHVPKVKVRCVWIDCFWGFGGGCGDLFLLGDGASAAACCFVFWHPLALTPHPTTTPARTNKHTHDPQDFYAKPCWAHHPKPYADFVEFKAKERAALEEERKRAVRA